VPRTGKPWFGESRRAAVALTAVGLALVVALALGTRTLVRDAAAVHVPTTEQMCAQYDELVAQLASAGIFSTQSAIHSARTLSVMAEVYVPPADGDAGVAAEPSVAQAGRDIRTVIGSVAWETRDLVTATRPVALECGWEWPVTATPPPADPRPPAS
jgi:hypothetical protein